MGEAPADTGEIVVFWPETRQGAGGSPWGMLVQRHLSIHIQGKEIVLLRAGGGKSQSVLPESGVSSSSVSMIADGYRCGVVHTFHRNTLHANQCQGRDEVSCAVMRKGTQAKTS